MQRSIVLFSLTTTQWKKLLAIVLLFSSGERISSSSSFYFTACGVLTESSSSIDRPMLSCGTGFFSCSLPALSKCICMGMPLVSAIVCLLTNSPGKTQPVSDPCADASNSPLEQPDQPRRMKLCPCNLPAFESTGSFDSSPTFSIAASVRLSSQPQGIEHDMFMAGNQFCTTLVEGRISCSGGPTRVI